MELLNGLLQERISEIRFRIKNAAKKFGREPEEIKLIGVTKNVDYEVIKQALGLGITDFGENRVQELLKKYEVIPEANWHFIGRLQANKVKYIIDKVCLIHSLDNINLAEQINKAAEKNNIIANVLVQVNISKEITKAGIAPEYCEEFLINIAKYNNIKVRGLMTIAPLTSDKKEIRRTFTNLNNLAVDISRKKIHNIIMEYLSAGMTNDFEIAIEEGANVIRVGRGIFQSSNFMSKF